ncbi:MAG: hypothetical protein WED04_11995 [Promethearchaeati archaeon SRVP18_Atabeyarchaeia-1]
MSKNVGFPVMSTSLTGILFVLGILLTTLGILVKGLAASLGPTNTALIVGILFFIGLFLFLWSLLSYSLNPDLEDYQRNVAFLFVVLITVILFGAGIAFVVTVG